MAVSISWGSFSKGPHIQSPTVLGSRLRPLMFGNSHFSCLLTVYSIDSKQLEYGPRTIYAVVPASLGSGDAGQSYPILWLLLHIHFSEGPSTQYSRSLVPKAIPSMAFRTRVLKYWVLGPSGFQIEECNHVTMLEQLQP